VKVHIKECRSQQRAGKIQMLCLRRKFVRLAASNRPDPLILNLNDGMVYQARTIPELRSGEQYAHKSLSQSWARS
jgi:hypothetical protein